MINQATLVTEDVTFEQNWSKDQASGIFLLGCNSSKFTRTTFKDNEAA